MNAKENDMWMDLSNGVDEVFDNNKSGLIYELSNNQSVLTVYDPKMRNALKELKFEEPLTWGEVLGEISELERVYVYAGYSLEDLNPNGEEWLR